MRKPFRRPEGSPCGCAADQAATAETSEAPGKKRRLGPGQEKQTPDRRKMLEHMIVSISRATPQFKTVQERLSSEEPADVWFGEEVGFVEYALADPVEEPAFNSAVFALELRSGTLVSAQIIESDGTEENTKSSEIVVAETV